jgi:hypothetical protein
MYVKLWVSRLVFLVLTAVVSVGETDSIHEANSEGKRENFTACECASSRRLGGKIAP